MAAAIETGSVLFKRLAAQVRILPHPIPRNLNESRQILAALQKFGEVVTYRNLKYDIKNTHSNKNRTILAIFDTGDAAHRALAASPLTVTLSPDASNPTEQPTTVTCTIEESRHNHASTMMRNPFYSPWGITKDEDRREIYGDIMSSMSETTRLSLRGLADVLQSTRKHYIGERTDDEVEALESSCSLMRLWKEGMENAEKKEEQVEREKDKARSGLRRVSRQMQRKEKGEEGETWAHGH